MEPYCKEKGLEYKVLWYLPKPKQFTFSGIPLVAPIRNRLAFIERTEEFFKNQKCKVVVSPPQSFYNKSLVRIAQKHGHTVLGLQWAIGAVKNTHDNKYYSFFKNPKKYHLLCKTALISVHKIVLELTLRTIDIFSREKRFKTEKMGGVKTGVFDRQSVEFYTTIGGLSHDKVIVVGSIETHEVQKALRVMESNTEERKRLCSKYNLDSSKMIIVVISMTFNVPGSTTYAYDNDGQKKYFHKLFKILRDNYSYDTHEIIFKMHPRETNIYTKSEQCFGVRVMGRESDLIELVALSSFVVTHPLTSANMVVIAAKRPTICVNFSPLDFLDECGEHFGFTHIVKTLSEFDQTLRQSKKESIGLPYNINMIEYNSEQKIKEFVFSD